MATKNLGKVFMTPKGIWDKNSNYTKLDIVTNKVGKISCGYIATTDIEKNVEITDNRWLKLFELLDGNPTDEQISSAVNSYLDKNPVSALDASKAHENQVPTADGNGNWTWKSQQTGSNSGEEKDPTVPDWAKQELGSGLIVTEDGKLSVDTADSVEEDNTKPVTSGAVYTVLGNIETLLSIL